ncbi:MAG: hypothetical protein IJF49_08425 [Clostridia bacterium]|nr:hypothetical protein [Clostridia bacterium]
MGAIKETTMEVVTTDATTKPARKSRGRVPQSTAGIDPDDVRSALFEVMEAYKQPKVRSDEEMLDRIALYFATCAERGSHPVLEEMALYCGYTLDSFWDIEHGRNKGFSPQTSAIVKKAKFCVQTLDAKLATSGKLNFLAYCFRAKNYYGMQDKVEHVVTSGTAEVYSRDDIASRYMIDGGDGTVE